MRVLPKILSGSFYLDFECSTINPTLHENEIKLTNFARKSKVKVKLSLCLTKHHATMMYPVLN